MGMMDNMKDMGKLLKQAKDMKSKMKSVQEELKKLIVHGSALKEKIKITLTGELVCQSVEVDPVLLDPKHHDVLQKGLREAFNVATKKSKDLATGKLSKISEGIDIPGLT
jgi:DNA-binding YbaB/EbfC family protein